MTKGPNLRPAPQEDLEGRTAYVYSPSTHFMQLSSLFRRNRFDISTEVGRSKERYRRVVLTTMTSVGARGIAIVTALVSVPLTLGYLGKERYGLWMTIGSIVAALGFADFGMGNGLLNAVAGSEGKNDRESTQKFVSSAFFLLSGTAILFAIGFALGYPWVHWPSVFNVTTEMAKRESGPALVALAVCFLVGLPLGIVNRIQVGHQEGFSNDVWQGAGSLLSLLAVLLGVHLEWGLPLLILAVTAGPLIASCCNGVRLFGWSRPWLVPRWKNVRFDIAKKLASSGFLFFILQISSVLLFASDNLIVAQVLGASAVPQYAVVQKAFLVVVTLQSTWLTPLWPAYCEALHRGDITWVRCTLKSSIVWAVVISGGLSVFLALASRPLFRFWVGPDLVPSWPLTIGFAGWTVLQAAGNAVAMYLNGSNELAFEVRLSLVFLAIAVPLKVLLCVHSGPAGVVWGTLIAYVIAVAVPLAVVLPRMLSKQVNPLPISQ